MPKLTQISFEATVSFSFPKLELDDETFDPKEVIGELVKIKSGIYENRYYGDVESIQNIREEVVEVGEECLSDESILTEREEWND